MCVKELQWLSLFNHSQNGLLPGKAQGILFCYGFIFFILIGRNKRRQTNKAKRKSCLIRKRKFEWGCTGSYI